MLVAGAVFLAYQSRDTDGSQAAAEVSTDDSLSSGDDPMAGDEVLVEDGVLLADRETDTGLQGDRSQVAQPLAPAAPANREAALDQRSSGQTFADDGNLVANGGFERPDLAETGFATPPGWASRERELEFWVDGHLGITADEGSQFIELNGRSAGRISQDIEVEPGQTYRWSFSHRARNDQDTVKALIDGELVTDATSLPGQWRTASGLFVAQEGQDVITFGIEAIDDGQFGNFIDNVRFEVQPGL